eukprot:TRINITY_DN14108_c0_g1_i1.p2 TRINITY_DN14108_c0_g1~~TRINITY_DN14108_c0_g1_i1.p2  ORF type:complete len:289 (-),score=53.59 TRINITY_DN14108_c0_g1_i1:358-1191(-)
MCVMIAKHPQWQLLRLRVSMHFATNYRSCNTPFQIKRPVALKCVSLLSPSRPRLTLQAKICDQQTKEAAASIGQNPRRTILLGTLLGATLIQQTANVSASEQVPNSEIQAIVVVGKNNKGNGNGNGNNNGSQVLEVEKVQNKIGVNGKANEQQAPSNLPPTQEAPPKMTQAPLDSVQIDEEAERRLLNEEEERRKAQRKKKKGRIRELEEIRVQLVEKEITLLAKEKELLQREQSIEVLQQELELERKIRALLTKEKERAEEEAALAMGLCTGGGFP